jgi:bla regulator protein BlaR1
MRLTMCPRSIALIFITACGSFGQAPPPPAFDAASVKLSSPADLRGPTFQFNPGGALKITNGTLRDIIETAYSARDFQILGGPGWLNSERYDISARSAPADAQTGQGNPANDVAETRLKLQTLLTQRFQLQVHREIKDLPIYALVVGKNGSKLIEGQAPASDGPPAGIRSGCGQMTGTMTSMANLAVYLERQLRRPVADRTGLSGKYNFQLDWTPDSGPCSPAANSDNGSSDAPSIFTAIEEKLGLKLESTKGPIEVIVVDRAEKADEN